MYQQFWRPWDDACQDIWVREMPEGCYRKEDFPFYTEDMWDYEFQYKFAHWLHIQKKRNVLAVLSEYGLKKAITVGEQYTAQKLSEI